MSPIQNFPPLREVEILTFLYWVNAETVHATGTRLRSQRLEADNRQTEVPSDNRAGLPYGAHTLFAPLLHPDTLWWFRLRVSWDLAPFWPTSGSIKFPFPEKLSIVNISV